MGRFKSTLAIFSILALLMFLGNLLSPDHNDSPRFDAPPKKKVTAVFAGYGNTKSAAIEYWSSGQTPMKGRSEFVILPHKVSLNSYDISVSADSANKNGEVICQLLDSSGKILDSDGPSESVSCRYSTY